MKRKNIIFLLILLLVSAGLNAQNFNKTVNTIDIAENETIVFLGNSITHQCLYTQYVEDYFYTRYPKKRINFFNAGVGGDKAQDALIRFDEDVARFKPKYVTVLIGMNDGQYTNFTDEIFNTYKKDMRTLLDKIAGINANAILMTPTMFDLRPALRGENWKKPDEVKNIHYNAVLSFFGTWLLQEANERGLGFVNMFELLNQVTRDQRKRVPDFTMIPDAVHPDPNGQLVMALALLEDMNEKPTVTTINITNEKDKRVFTADNGTLSEVNEESISFTFTANSLPWIVPEEAALGYDLAGASRKMNREVLRVTGLTPSDYYLQIDYQITGSYNHLQLAAGIELQDLPNTPQYEQAMQVALLNKQKNEEVVNPLRDQWSALKRIRKAGKVDKTWMNNFNKKVDELLAKAKEFEDKIYQINKPEPHIYRVRPTR
jgi:lysophospholipase L1-like esterase